VECLLIGKQKILLFLTFRENRWVATENALTKS
jgi:hypothetical protein